MVRIGMMIKRDIGEGVKFDLANFYICVSEHQIGKKQKRGAFISENEMEKPS